VSQFLERLPRLLQDAQAAQEAQENGELDGLPDLLLLRAKESLSRGNLAPKDLARLADVVFKVEAGRSRRRRNKQKTLQ
jgi:hypothetical protein